MNGNSEIKKTSRLKKLIKRKSFWIVALIVLIIVGYIFSRLGASQNKFVYTSEPVKRGQLVQTVSATGAVESVHSISLSFKASSRVVNLKVDEGDQVKAGSVLAQIDAGTALAQASQYRANLSAARADLERIKAGSSAEDIKVSEEQLSKVAADLENLRRESSDQLNIFRDKALTSLSNAIFTAPVALDKVYNYLINDNLTVNLLVDDSLLKSRIEVNYISIKQELLEVKILVDTAGSQKTNETIISAAVASADVLNKINSFLNDSYGTANSIVINSSYPQTTKDTIKSDISAQQTINNAALTSLQTAQSNLVNNINSYSSQIKAAENNLAIYQAQLDFKRAGPRDFEILSAEAKVAQAQAQLDQALAVLADYTIVAPVDGLITKVNINVGEQASPSQSAIDMLSAGKFEIQVDIPESDIVKIKIGDKATVDLDAFGSDHFFTGAVAFIDPAQTVIQDVIYYRTTISLNDDAWDSQIKPGMTANVTVNTVTKDNVLYIPQRAVKIKESSLGETPEKFVEILVNGQPQEKIVTIGIRGDNGLVELLSGLNEGDSVITFKKNGK